MKFKKSLLIITSLLVLAPILIGGLMWKELPEQMATHWGMSGAADDWSSRAFAVFGIPMLLLVIHWVCIIITAADHKSKNQNKKAYHMVLFITPLISWFCNAMMYASAFGLELNKNSLIFGLLGIMFIVIGNYMPKIKQNHTLGIKIKWTYESEENWNATHRMAGKLWFVVGLICLICVFIPHSMSIVIMPILLIAAVIIPIVYSYKFHRKEIKEGKTFMKNKKMKKPMIITAIVVAIIAVVLLVIMFSGSIEITYNENSFTVDSTFASALTVEYSDISGVWYTEDYIEGDKVNGFNSAKLKVGKFKNEALETYDRYTYTGNNAFVVVETTNEKGELHYIVLGAESFEKTADIYHKLSGERSFEITYGEDSFTVTPTQGEPVTVNYSQVGSTQYREEYIEGEKKNGFESNEIMLGEYKNDEFGTYKRYTYSSNDAYIIIEVIDGSETLEYVILNQDSLESTKTLYDELSETVVG